MTVEELRQAHRFLAVEAISGSFGSTDASLLNISIGGVQISHAQPLRIGTVARLTLHHRDVTIATQARVLWSHVTPAGGGKLVYRTGLRIEAIDAQYAMSINSLIRANAIKQDAESLSKKRQRQIEREEEKSKSRLKPLIVPRSEPM